MRLTRWAAAGCLAMLLTASAAVPAPAQGQAQPEGEATSYAVGDETVSSAPVGDEDVPPDVQAAYERHDACLVEHGADRWDENTPEPEIDAAFTACDPILASDAAVQAYEAQFAPPPEVQAAYDRHDACLVEHGSDGWDENTPGADVDAAFDACDPILDDPAVAAYEAQFAPSPEEEAAWEKHDACLVEHGADDWDENTPEADVDTAFSACDPIIASFVDA